MSVSRRTRLRIGRSFQILTVFANLTTSENVRIAADRARHRPRSGPVGPPDRAAPGPPDRRRQVGGGGGESRRDRRLSRYRPRNGSRCRRRGDLRFADRQAGAGTAAGAAGYAGSRVLDGIDLVVREGEAVALLGRSGVGTTTLLRTIMGAVRATDGDIRLDGVSLVGARSMSSIGAASPSCPRGGGCSRTSPWPRTCASRRAAAARRSTTC